jgi:Bifunctional DNA primase/polymerase, N-terminal
MQNEPTLRQTTLDRACQYIAQGWSVIPIPRGRKTPIIKDWPNLRIREDNAHEFFNGQPLNIGIILGAASRNLIDIDLDCPEAVTLAPHFLPDTPAIFGHHPSKQKSHYLYYSETKQRKFKAPDGRVILEIRSDFGQTIFPGSVHPSGETIEWSSAGPPSQVASDEINNAVGKLAACSLLAQTWKVAQGSRHDLGLALAGGLARAGWTEDDAIKFIVCAAETAGDDELEDRQQAASDTFEKVDTSNVKGWPSVATIIGDQAVQRMREFLGITAKEGEQSNEVPIIQANDRLPSEIADEALSALVNANDPPFLFVRGGKLTRVRADENGRPIVEVLTVEHLRERLGRVARFVNQGKRGHVTIQTPLTVVQDIRARGSWPFPPLEAITESPTLRKNGSILNQRGYDPSTRLIYHPEKGFVMPTVPDSPTRADVAQALVTLIDVLDDFPFLDQASRANTLALMLTPIIRPHIDLAPLALLDAPQAGTGKGLLTDVVSIIATGRPAAKGVAPRDDEEIEKRITSLLSEGSTFIVFDDVAHTLRSPVLAGALTTCEWKGRILGRSEMIAIPQRATWIVTGNNISLAGDIPRRCFWIRLDAKTSRPYLRENFKHPNLMSHIKEHRGALLSALFTLARSWHCAGCPPSSMKPLGSFEGWTKIIGGILEHAGIPGFLCNATELYEQADDESAQWEGFLCACHEAFGNVAVTSSDLALRIESDPSLSSSLPDFLADARSTGKGDFKKLIGKALRKRIDRQYGDDGLHVTRAGNDTSKKVAQWKFSKNTRKGDERPRTI